MCEQGCHRFEWGKDPFARRCARCNRQEPERAIVCICGGSVGRDFIRYAHRRDPYQEDGEPEYLLYEMFGLLCPRCGMNWAAYQRFGTDWRGAVDLKEITDSEEERVFYLSLTAEWQARLIPQLYVEVAPHKGYFIDWFDKQARIGIEIDGKQHKTQMEYDLRRDRAIEQHAIRVVRIPAYTVRHGIFSKILETAYALPLGA